MLQVAQNPYPSAYLLTTYSTVSMTLKDHDQRFFFFFFHPPTGLLRIARLSFAFKCLVYLSAFVLIEML